MEEEWGPGIGAVAGGILARMNGPQGLHIGGTRTFDFGFLGVEMQSRVGAPVSQSVRSDYKQSPPSDFSEGEKNGNKK